MAECVIRTVETPRVSAEVRGSLNARWTYSIIVRVQFLFLNLEPGVSSDGKLRTVPAVSD